MIKIKCADCVEYMRSIADESIDMIIADPPYGIKYLSNQRKRSQKFAMLENDDNDSRFMAYQEFPRILKNNSVAAVFASWKNISKDFDMLADIMNIKNVIIWDKGGGGIGDLKHTLITDYECMLICHKGKCQIKSKREGSVWKIPKVPCNSMIHPTEKPITLLEKAIKIWTNPGAMIFDPFAGCGTCGIAAINTGRDYIGVDIDPHWIDIATKRINAHIEGNA